MAREIVVATRNEHKLREFRRLLEPYGWTAIGLDDTAFSGELEESGETYEENALSKARDAFDQLRRPTLADDSGIEIEKFGDWPGVATARWLGEGKSDKDRLYALLERVKTEGSQNFNAKYVCVLAVILPDENPEHGSRQIITRGETTGTIVEPDGDNGFGYDPIFLSDDLHQTFGVAPDHDKDRVSHRARAVQKLADAGALAEIPTRSGA